MSKPASSVPFPSCRASHPQPMLQPRGEVGTLAGFRPVNAGVSVIGLVFLSGVLLQAQVSVAPGAPPACRPTVSSSPKGAVVVQIAAPNASGVSNNHYSQFNADSRGVILNNSLTATETRSGGAIAGNAFITDRGARLILNQVLGSEPSRLHGPIEVAGRMADLVIANPNGISCNGALFLNVRHGVLTTGLPLLDSGGQLEGLKVQTGRIQVQDGGLRAEGSERLDLIARSIEIHGKIITEGRLNVITGIQTVGHPGLATQPLPERRNQPELAIDLGQLGGMYAGRIHLIATEFGLGVRLQGELATSQGDFSLESGGRIVLSGDTRSHSGIRMQTPSAVENNGTIQAAGDLRILAGKGIQNGKEGAFTALGNIVMEAPLLDSHGILAAGTDAEGRGIHPGNLEIHVSGALQASGQNQAGGRLRVLGQRLDLDGATFRANGDAECRAEGTGRDDGISHRGGTFEVVGGLRLETGAHFDNEQGTIRAGVVTLRAKTLSNRNGTIATSHEQGETHLAVAEQLDNSNGTLASRAKSLRVEAGSILNQKGRIEQTGSGELTLDMGGKEGGGPLLNAEGRIQTEGRLSITTANINNPGGLLSARERAMLMAVTGDIDNRSAQEKAGGSIRSREILLFSPEGAIFNRGGSVESSASTFIQAKGFDNGGGVLKVLDDLEPGTAEPHPGSEGRVHIAVDWLRNEEGRIRAGGNIGVQISSEADNGKGTLEAGGDIEIQGKGPEPQGGMEAGSRMRNHRGMVRSGRDILLREITFGAWDGTIRAGRDLNIQDTPELINHGLLEAGGCLKLNGGTIWNGESGRISGGGSGLEIASDSKVLNKGVISGSSISITAPEVTNEKALEACWTAPSSASTGPRGADSGAAGGSGLALATRHLVIKADIIHNLRGSRLRAQGNITLCGYSDRDGRPDGLAQEIVNRGAEILCEGDLVLNAVKVWNQNDGFELGDHVPRQADRHMFQPMGSGQRYEAGSLPIVSGFNGVGNCLRLPDGSTVHDYYEYEVTERTHQQYVKSSRPSLMKAGGGLFFRGETFTNDKSRMQVGGNIEIAGDLFNNEPYIVQEVTTTGSVRSTWTEWHGGMWADRERRWSPWAPYNPEPMVTRFRVDLGEEGRPSSVPPPVTAPPPQPPPSLRAEAAERRRSMQSGGAGGRRIPPPAQRVRDPERRIPFRRPLLMER